MICSFVGNFEPPYSTENDVAEAFELIGWTLIRLQENRVTDAEIRASALQSDLLLWCSTWPEMHDVAATIDTVHALAVAGIPSATIHLDTFWPVARGGRKWWLEPMFRTSTVFTADGDWDLQFGLAGINHRWLPPGVRASACTDGTPRDEYRCDVAFVGSDGHGYHETDWPYRRHLVDQLEAMCDRNGWVFRNPGGREPKVMRDDDMNDFYASASVTVGDSLCVRQEAARYWSDRVPEATGRGGFLIMPDIAALRTVWPEMPVYPWGNWTALEALLDKYLAHDHLRALARDDCTAITRNGHTYVHRVQELLAVLGLR